MGLFKAILGWMTEPAAVNRNSATRRRARLLSASLLLALLVLLFPAAFSHIEPAIPENLFRVACLVVFATYILSRTPHYRPAAVLYSAGILLAAGLHLLILTDLQFPIVTSYLFWFSIPLGIGTLAFYEHGALPASLVVLLGALLLPGGTPKSGVLINSNAAALLVTWAFIQISLTFWIRQVTFRRAGEVDTEENQSTGIQELLGARPLHGIQDEPINILFEHAPDAYYVNDLKGVFLDGNQAAEDLTGYSRQELVGRSFFKLDLLSAPQIPKAAKLLALNVLGRSTGPDEFVLTRKDGSEVTVEVRTFPTVLDKKKVVLGIARDLTARKEAMEALRRSHNELEALVRLRTADLEVKNAELVRANKFVAALGRVAANMGASSVPEEVMEMIGQELAELGLTCLIALLDPEGKFLVIRYTSYSRTARQMVEKLTGMNLADFQIPRRGNLRAVYDNIVDQRQTLFFSELLPLAKDSLPRMPESVLERALRVIGIRAGTRMIYAPLAIPDRVLGVLGLWGQNLRKEDTAAVSVFAGQVAIALENSRLVHRLKRRTLEISTLLDTAGAVNSTLNLENVLRRIADRLVQVAGVDGCTLSRWDRQADTVVTWIEVRREETEIADEPGATYPLGDYPATRAVLEHCEALVIRIDDPKADAAEIALMKSRGISSLLMLPMVRAGKTIGLVELDQSEHLHTFSPAEIQFCQTLADQAAIAIDNAYLHAETERQLQEQILLREASEIICSTLDAKTVLSRMAEQMGKAVNATSTYICSFDTERMATVTLAEYLGPRARGAELESDLGSVYIEESEIEFVEKMLAGKFDYSYIDDPELTESERAHMLEYGANTILYIPLLVKGELLGFAEIWESEFRRVFTPEEIAICQGIAQQAAIALENARLFEQAQQEIRERTRTEEALRLSEERYALAAQGANDGLWDWLLETDQIYFSPRWKAVLGYEDSEIGDRPDEWFDRVHPDDFTQLELIILAHREGHSANIETEHRVRHKDGTYRWVLVRGLAVREENGEPYRIAGSLTDITGRKRAEEQRLHDAFHDAITALPNRALFEDRLSNALGRAHQRRDGRFGVLVIDLDRFKQVNERFGYSSGDKLLGSIGQRISSCVRDTDTVARLGGDEFAVLIEEVADVNETARLANRIQEKLRQPLLWDDHEIFVSASIGIVISEPEYDRPDEVLRDADIAVLQAKSQGKARYVLFQGSMRSRALARSTLEVNLRRAIPNQEFQVYYQPIMCLDDEMLAGFEALVRWRHPTRGLVLPAEFIPLAEETELIVPIDRLVLETACRQINFWNQKFRPKSLLSVNVNLSSLHFSSPDLAERVEHILGLTGLEAKCLRLEITESIVLDQAESATAALDELKELGVEVQIDDFGTGYSSLSYLHRLPVGAIKIDRSFISRMGVTNRPIGLVHTIVSLANELGLKAVAEGVETVEQLNKLKALKCRFGQGFLFSEPLDPEAAESFIAQNLRAREEDLAQPDRFASIN